MKRDHNNVQFRFMERVSEMQNEHTYVMYKTQG